MPTSKDFIEWVQLDLLRGIPELTVRAMFGGYSLYSEGLIFGLIDDGQLYFKVSDTNRKAYEEEGSHQFEYKRGDGTMGGMSYWLVPDDVMESPKDATKWALIAIEVSKERKKGRNKKV